MYVLAAVVLAATAEAAPTELTLPDAYRRAREAAGAVLAGAARVEEARGRLLIARAPRENPSLEATFGRRGAAADAREASSRSDLEFGLAQTLEVGGKRGARVRAATAALEREVETTADVTRRVLAEVGAQFYEAARARERARVATASEQAAAELLRVARVRLQHGDVAALDVNLAETLLARGKASRISLLADQAVAISNLKGLLRLPREAEVVPAVEADLGALAPPLPVPNWGDAVTARPEVRALDAEVREARAEIDVARALRWPDPTPSVRYSREDGTPIVWGGLTIALPLLNRGAGERATAEARLRRAEIELASTRARVEAELQSAYDAYGARRAAAESLAAVRETLDENLDLARRSYESGQIGLGELLVVRRETLEARGEALDLLFNAAIARVQLEAAIGVLR